jgi:CHASE2 domain-containing sensor protein
MDLVAARKRLSARLMAAVALAAVALGVAAYLTDSFRRLELDTVDARFSVRGQRGPPKDIAVIGIDAETFEYLQKRWPFTHNVHARLVDRLAKDRVRQIVFDIQFSEPSDTDRQTLALVDAVTRAGNVVLDTAEIDDRGNGNAFNYIVPDRILRRSAPRAINQYILEETGAAIGAGLLANDPGGVARRVNYAVRGLRTVAVVVAQRLQNRLVNPKELEGGAWIDYYGPPGTIKHYSYSDVLRGLVGRRELENKIVVVGATSPTLQDYHQTSTSTDGNPMSGPEIQANAIETALHRFPLHTSSQAVDLLLIALMGLIAPVAALLTSPLRALLAGLLAGVAYIVASQMAFEQGTILPVVYPLIALGVASVGILISAARGPARL